MFLALSAITSGNGHGSARGASPALPIVVRPRRRTCARHYLMTDTDVRKYLLHLL